MPPNQTASGDIAGNDSEETAAPVASMWAQTRVLPSTFEQQRVPSLANAALGPAEVLLRVSAGGLCGSDFPYFKGALPLSGSPLALGHSIVTAIPGAPMHEVAGEVLASQDPEIRVGAVAVGWASRHNALAEYVITDGGGLVEYDAGLRAATAITIQPLACVIYALEQIRGIHGAVVAVIGLGPIGVLFTHVLKSMGASHVVGVDRIDRSDVKSSFGLDEVVQASSDQWAASLDTTGERPSIVIEAVGHQTVTLKDAVDAVAHGGQIFYFGMPDDLVYPLPMVTLLRKDGTLITGTTRDKRRSLKLAKQYLDVHPDLKDSYVTHELPISDVQAAFELAIKPAQGRLKVVVTVR